MSTIFCGLIVLVSTFYISQDNIFIDEKTQSSIKHACYHYFLKLFQQKFSPLKLKGVYDMRCSAEGLSPTCR